jgi:signal transduction histidine kinase
MVALMMNAVEAMAPVPGRAEGGILAIEARWSERRDSLVVRVSDTGQGMSEEIKAHIFEPFFTTKSEGKGVGLGLAIAYGIIERHHGMLEVESTPGQGTVFAVTLPTKQPDAAPVQDSLAAPPEGAHS